MTYNQWTEGDDLAAEKEGWGLMYSKAEAGLKVQLEALDGRPDEEIWLYVMSKSFGGSPLHVKAIEFIKEENPMEYKAMESWSREYYLVN